MRWCWCMPLSSGRVGYLHVWWRLQLLVIKWSHPMDAEVSCLQTLERLKYTRYEYTIFETNKMPHFLLNLNSEIAVVVAAGKYITRFTPCVTPRIVHTTNSTLGSVSVSILCNTPCTASPNLTFPGSNVFRFWKSSWEITSGRSGRLVSSFLSRLSRV